MDEGSKVTVGVEFEAADGKRMFREVQVKNTGLWASQATKVLREWGELTDEDLVIRVFRVEQEEDDEPVGGPGGLRSGA